MTDHSFPKIDPGPAGIDPPAGHDAPDAVQGWAIDVAPLPTPRRPVVLRRDRRDAGAWQPRSRSRSA